MPWTMGAFAIGALSMIGVPPTVGFTSKWFILQGAVQAEQFAAIAVVFASTLLNAAYFLPIIHQAFFRPQADDDDADHGEAPLLIVIALTATAFGTVLLFFLPDLPLGLARQLIVGD
jgi:multicomponent Na+:H+ antiporter subunit D